MGRVFKEHKADIVYQFPEKGTPLEMAGQTIYVVRFKENYICPDKIICWMNWKEGYRSI